jgi:hypothetical protein
MRRIVLLGLVAWVAFAESHWVQIRTGPFELYTDASGKAGRLTLGWFDQCRYVLGYMLGNQDLQTSRPVRILLFKNAKERAEYPATAPIVDGRDRWDILLIAEVPIPHEVLRECTRLFLENNTGRMPAAIERGIADMLSTIQVNGTHVTLGNLPPPGERNRDWARMHLFATNADYYAKLRILLYNLQKGADEDPAYLNAFGKSRAEMEKEVDQHIAAGNYETAAVDGKALSVERDYKEQPLLSKEVRLAQADLLLGSSSRAEYQALIQEHEYVAASYEGLGAMAVRNNQLEEARRCFSEAINAGTPSALSYIAYARLEPDNVKALAALDKVLKLNPKLAEAYTLIGRRQTDGVKRIQYLEKAAQLSPREAGRWEDLAKACLDEKVFDKAAQAWHNAEHAATTAEDRERYSAARVAIDQQRLDWQDAERKRLAAEREREIRRLKDKAIADLRATEAKANAGQGSAPEKVEKWWDGPQPNGRATGSLTRVDCVGRQLRLVIEAADHKLTRLLIRDPSNLAILGGGDQKLGCGVQKPRPVVVEYFAKRDAKLATVGEVATIQFQ